MEDVKKKEKVVFANGVFDILHPGHIDVLKFAKSLGDRLIVAINSDSSVKETKGPDRPINSEGDRRVALLALGFIDEVVIFDEPTTREIIRKIRPDIVVKGGEWSAEEVRKIDQVPEDIEIVMCPLTMKSPGIKYSTTEIIREGNIHTNQEDGKH